MPSPTRRARLSVLTLLIGGIACPASEQWSGRASLPTNVESMSPVVYREHWSDDPSRMVYSIRAPGARFTDVAYLGALDELDERARDDGRPPDRAAGDGELTGSYALARHRRNPSLWPHKTRQARPGDNQRPLPSKQEASHPYANRRLMAGTSGGDYDAASVCPPHYVMTGVKARRDVVQRNLARLAPLCRPLPAPGIDPQQLAPVEGTGWGDEMASPLETKECPPDSAVAGEGRATMGTWSTYAVVAGITLSCASLKQPSRPSAGTLEVGYPAEHPDESQPFSCLEARGALVKPFAVGLRLIAGRRIDAVGMYCDVDGREEPAPVEGMLWEPERGKHSEALTFPLRPAGGDGKSVKASARRQLLEMDRTTLLLRGKDAKVMFEPAEGTDIRAVADGCVVGIREDAVIVAHGVACPSGSGARFYAEYRARAEWLVKVGANVSRGMSLGRFKGTAQLRLRLVTPDEVGGKAGSTLPDHPFLELPGELRERVLVLAKQALDGGTAPAP